jgi:hypothetical protein
MALQSYWEDARPTAGNVWDQSSSMTPWPARYGHSSVRTSTGAILVIGGMSEDPNGAAGDADAPVRFSDVWRSSDEGVTWECANPSAAFGARSFSASAAIGARVYVAGGEMDDDEYKNDVWYSDDDGETWTSAGAAPWSGRGRHSLALNPSNSNLMLIGGRNADTVFADVWTFDGTTWTARESLATARFGHGHAIFSGGRAYVLGGSTLVDGAESVLTGASIFVLSTNNGATWAERTGSTVSTHWPNGITGCRMEPRFGSTTTMYVTGGKSGVAGSAYFNDVWISTDTGTSWSVLTPNARWPGRVFHTLVSSSNTFLVLMGGARTGGDPSVATSTSNDIWRLNTTLSTNAWNQISSQTFMEGRSLFGLAVVNTNDVVIVGGLAQSGGVLNDVWRSNDAGRNFYQVTAAAPFSARSAMGCTTIGDTIYISGGSATRDVWASSDGGTNWTSRTTNGGFGAIDSHGFVSIDVASGGTTTTYLVILGGRENGSTNRNSIWYSANTGASWSAVTNVGGIVFSARQAFGCVSTGSAIMVMGATAGTNADSSSVWRGTFTSFNTMTWVQMTSMPKRTYHAHASIQNVGGTNYVYVLHGGNNTTTLTANTSYTTDDGASWTEVTSSVAWSPRRGARSIAVDGRVLVIGGLVQISPTIRGNDVWYSTSATLAAWQAESPNGKAGRFGSAMAMLDDTAFLVGGNNGAFYMSDVWKTSDRGETWTLVKEFSEWGNRTEHTVTASSGRLILFGGNLSDGTYAGDTWAYHSGLAGDAAENWAQLEIEGPPGRSEHASVATRTGSILLCGGFDGTNYLNDTWVLEWSSVTWSDCAWRQVSSSAPWTARSQHSFVRLSSTHDNCLLLGGMSASGPLRDVWMFNASSESWSSVIESAPWSARYSHVAALLTDDTIILHGGSDSEGSYLSDAWRCEDGVGQAWSQVAYVDEGDAAPAGRIDHCAVALADGLLVVDGISGGAILNDSWVTYHGWTVAQPLSFRRRAASDLTRLNLGSVPVFRYTPADHITVERTLLGSGDDIVVPSGSVLWLARLQSKWDPLLRSTVVARLHLEPSASFTSGASPNFELLVRFTNSVSGVISSRSSVQAISQSAIESGASVAVCQIPLSAESAHVVVQEGVFQVVSGVTTLLALTGPSDAMAGTKYVEIGVRPVAGFDSLVVTVPQGGTILTIDSISPPRWAGVSAIAEMESSVSYAPAAKLESESNIKHSPMLFHSTDSEMLFQFGDTLSGPSPVVGARRADWLASLDACSRVLPTIYSELIVDAPVGTVDDSTDRFFVFSREGSSGTRTIDTYGPHGPPVLPVPYSDTGSYIFVQRSSAENRFSTQGTLSITSALRGTSADGMDVLTSLVRFSAELAGFAGGDPHVWSLNGTYTLPARPMAISFLDTLAHMGGGRRLGINCTAELLTMAQIADSCSRAKRPDKMAHQLRSMTFWGIIFAFRQEEGRSAMVAIHAETLQIMFAKGDVFISRAEAPQYSFGDVSNALICVGNMKKVPSMPDSRCPTSRIKSQTAHARTIMFPRVVEDSSPLCFTLSADPVSCPFDRSSIEFDMDLCMRAGISMNTTQLRKSHGAIIGPDRYDSLESVFEIRPLHKVAQGARRVTDRWVACEATGRHIRVDRPQAVAAAV